MAIASKPDHGALGSCSSDGLKGANCSFTCNPGYVVVGANFTCRNNAWQDHGFRQHCVRECLHVGQSCLIRFAARAETCPRMLSSDPLVPREVGYPGTCANGGLEGGHCNIDCDLGFTRQGSPLTCTAGAWTGSQTCQGACVGSLLLLLIVHACSLGLPRDARPAVVGPECRELWHVRSAGALGAHLLDQVQTGLLR
jgi:hypothetical protein